jgi:hypothetical protein
MVDILFDLDGTLVDYDKALKVDLKRLASPFEPDFESLYYEMPEYLDQRRHTITSQLGWWVKLEKFKLGWDIFEAAENLGMNRSILSKGPQTKPGAWAEKLMWCNQHCPKTGVTITHDKSKAQGHILVDDWPDYVIGWLNNHPLGLAILPLHPNNEDFYHPNAVVYKGKNLEEVIWRMKSVNQGDI